MNVFLTGAGGFIGSHLAEKLVKSGYKLKALVQYNSLGRLDWLDHIDPKTLAEIEVLSGDIRDLSFIKRAVKGSDAVLHLAALIGIPYSYVNPESYIDTNIKGTMNVLEAAREYDVQKIINTSTSEVYGTAEYVPIDEKHPLKGQSPYSASKIAADQMAYAYHSSFEMPVVTVRPFNTFGPRQSLRAVIPTIILQALKNDGRVELGALEPTRDFTYVSDTVHGFIKALESKNTDIFGEVINLGSNFEISIGDTVALVQELIQSDIKIQQVQERLRPPKSEVERLFCDNRKARELLGWTPEFEGRDGFKKALGLAIEWFSEEENRAQYPRHGYHV